MYFKCIDETGMSAPHLKSRTNEAESEPNYTRDRLNGKVFERLMNIYWLRRLVVDGQVVSKIK